MKFHKDLLKGSLILLISFNLFNLINFLFHFSMARMLSISDYGILATLFTIVYILAVFSESIQLVITKYTAEEEEKGKLKNILKKSFKKAFLFSLILFFIYIVLSIFISKLLKIEYFLMLLNGLIIFGVFLAPVTRGVLQGKKRFTALGINMIAESLIKISLAIFFVYIGWRVYGAILGTVIGMSLAILLSFFSLTDITRAKEKNSNTLGIYKYGSPTLVIMLIILVFYNIDIIIAKILFSAEIAGVYAIAAILAKTIFMGTQPISKAMFPLTSKKNKDEKKLENILLNALCMLSVIILIALAAFYFLPGLIVRVFTGRYIPEAARILFFLGIAISLNSFASLILLYRLSLRKIKNYIYLFVFLAIEILLLSYFSNNLLQFSLAFITASAIFLWGAISLLE